MREVRELGDWEIKTNHRYLAFEARSEMMIDLGNWEVVGKHKNWMTKNWTTYIVYCRNEKIYNRRKSMVAGRKGIRLLI